MLWLLFIADLSLVTSVQEPVGFDFPPDPQTSPRLLLHRNVQHLQEGFIDPTKAPYNAAGDGKTDDSVALQEAVDDAYHSRMSVVLPAGRIFLLSRQLAFRQHNRSRAFGFQIFGGAGELRPVLRLQDGSNVVNNTFVLFELLPEGSIPGHENSEHYNSRIRGINLDLGYNPQVSGISMSGAQMCSIEDVYIMGKSFYAGIAGLPGSGGFSANVVVEGGTYGIVQNSFRPNPSISGLTLLRQQKAGLFVNISRGPVVISGFYIDSGPNPSSDYRAVILVNDVASKDNAFNGEDGKIQIHGAADGGLTHTLSPDKSTIAIESAGSDVVLRNVYLQGADLMFASPIHNTQVPVKAADKWSHISSFVFSASGGQVWDHGHNHTGNNVTTYLSLPIQNVSSPPNNLTRLHSWDWDLVPTWQTNATINVCTEYGATPQWVNDTDDDGEKIQQAIADACDPLSHKFGAAIFIPHGGFRLSRPLDLRGCARVFGAGTHSTVLQPLQHIRSCWPDSPDDHRALLVSSPANVGHNYTLGVMFSDISLYMSAECAFVDLSAGHFLWRDVAIVIASPKEPPPRVTKQTGYPSPPNHTQTHTLDIAPRPTSRTAPPGGPQSPYVQLRGDVSGKFFGLPLDAIFGGKNAASGGPSHVLILVESTGWSGGEIHFYQASTEHLVHDPQVLVTDSQNVHFHAWKYESSLHEPPGGSMDSGSLLWVRNSSHVTTFGASGNYRMYNAPVPMVRVIRSSKVSLLGMVRKAAWNEPKGVGLHWVCDDAYPVCLSGDVALLMYCN